MTVVLLVFALISLALTGLGVFTFGWVPALAVAAAVLVHELGHAGIWLIRGQRPSEIAILVSPYFGLTVPMGLTDDDQLSPFEEGILVVSGCLFSLFMAFLVWFADLVSPHALVTFRGGFWSLFLLMLLFCNVLNTSLVLPITDGGHLLLLLVSGKGYGRTVLLCCLWTLAGAATVCVMHPWVAVVLIALSLWLFLQRILPTVEPRLKVTATGATICFLPSTSLDVPEVLRTKERIILAGAWALALLGSVGLFFAHPVFRRLCRELLTGFSR